MKKINLFAIIGIVLLAFNACDSEPSGPFPESFPKKHLIEEFTGTSIYNLLIICVCAVILCCACCVRDL